MTFDKTKPKPRWLLRKHDNANTQRGQRYYLNLWNAQPVWADKKAINAMYRRARALRLAGRDVEVDHIVPLIHPLVCGLHVSYNLRILERSLNAKKSNHTFPGMQFAQRDLFTEQIAPADFDLDIQNGF